MTEKMWIALGLLAQGLFTGRFLVQWVASERLGRSHVPVAFWYLSIFGGSILFLYAVHRRDIVFTLGQSCGLLVYIRNLYLIHRRRAVAVP